MGLIELISKYSTSGPRYTSYPTAPHWVPSVTNADYARALERIRPGEPLALYVHLPFCEKLCYYCGCNIQITGDKSRSRSYVDTVLKEAEAVRRHLRDPEKISQMSWGGGTPTFLTVQEMRDLYAGIRELWGFEEGAEISLEVDPRVTSDEQLVALRELGFNRVSLGVQDFNPQVQQAINRIQPAPDTAAMRARCRELGFEGVNFDLIYGLPFQTPASFDQTIDRVLDMRPDRIALYNYARLPSLLKHQSILEKYPMPSAEDRVALFTGAFERLVGEGYRAIGMDHFAVETDSLARSLAAGKLYRNFMGYTVKQGRHLLGLGASAISEAGGGFFQNVKKPQEYEKAVMATGLVVQRGLLLSDEDRQRQWLIQRLLCHFGFDVGDFEREFNQGFFEKFSDEWQRLAAFEEDGLLERQATRIGITERGRLFIRNIAMVFDAYLAGGTSVYSKTV